MEQKINTNVEVLIKWFMFTSAITGLGIVAAFWPVKANVPFIVIPSILVLLFAKPVFFEKLKLTTLVIIRLLIIVVALGFFDGQLYVNIVLWMLVVNILEATFTDLILHKQYYNAVSGFLVAIGVFALSGTWVSSGVMHNYYLANGATTTITILYVIAYTLWNIIFVSYEFRPSVTLMHFGVLSAPIFGSIINGWLGALGGVGLWLILRANTLSIAGWMQIGNKAWFEKEYYLPWMERLIKWSHKKSVQIVFMCINIILMMIVLIMAYQTGSFVLPTLF